MTRILFVDDEPMVLNSLRRAMRQMRSEWDTAFSESGEAALRAIDEGSFDVVVSDMRMPGMDGAMLLENVTRVSPGSVRIILSGYVSADASERFLPVAHQVLSKPCGPVELVDILERACALRYHLTNESVRCILGSIDRLPSLPEIYDELTHAVHEPYASFGSIAEIIERDMAMSAKVLQLANSAFFRPAQPFTSVEGAILHLGLQVVSSLVLTLEVFGAMENIELDEGVSAKALQRHALLTQAIARDLVDDPRDRDAAGVAGLLHDLGLLVLAAKLPDHLHRAAAAAREQQIPFHEAERALYGATHAEVGAYLLAVWGLPTPIVEGVAYHNNAATDGGPTIDVPTAVRMADLLATEFGPPELRGTVEPDTRLDASHLAAGVAHRIEEWRVLAAEQAAAV